jgi:predicted DNA-binding transcriptional regulator AlpA
MASKKVKKRLSFFFLNKNLHRVLHINRSKDLIQAWDYGNEERRVYLWSDVKKKMESAFSVTETAALVGRHHDRLWHYISNGDIPRPVRSPSLETGNSRRSFFSESSVMEIHKFLQTVHRGRPRKDGRITSNNLPSREEMKALVSGSRMLYTKTDDGEFIPVWREEIW